MDQTKSSILKATLTEVRVSSVQPSFPACIEYGFQASKSRVLSPSAIDALSWPLLQALEHNSSENPLGIVLNLCVRDVSTIKVLGCCTVSFEKYGVVLQSNATISIEFKEELSNGAGTISGQLHLNQGEVTVCDSPAFSRKIAIVGLGLHFPAGAEDLNSYWDLLKNKKSAIREAPEGRLCDRDDIFIRGGFVNDVSGFDARFFKLSPKEAAQLDPQQFHLLECTWECLEDAGIKPADVHDSQTGVFVGCGFGEHLSQAVSDSDNMSRFSPTTIIPCMIANRVSYCFGFRGPSVTVDTACAGSLTAVHYGCSLLQSGSCKLALCGGSNFLTETNFFIAIKQAQMNSPTGESMPFDAHANGYVRAEGAGMCALKLYEDAVADGDRIHAIILGSGCNHNGTSGLAFTTPSALAQGELCKNVAQRANVDVATVRYVEAHGTSTSVGDPIEADALDQVFAKANGRTIPFSIGSVKSNLGHMEAASGMGSLCKAILMMKHKTLVPSINIKEINPKIKCPIQRDFTSLADLPVVRIGVNSFGLGGSNANVLLEAPPTPAVQNKTPFPVVIPLSSISMSATQSLASSWAAMERGHLPEAAAFQASFRTHFRSRAAFVASSEEDFAAQAKSFASATADNKIVFNTGKGSSALIYGTTPESTVLKAGLIFGGQGSQWPAMAVDLYQSIAVFKSTMDLCDSLLQKKGNMSMLKSGLCSPNPPANWEQQLELPSFTVLSIGMVELALWETLKSIGVVPAFAMGHSMGEVAAAYAASAIDLDDAMLLLWARAIMMDRCASKGGAMAAISCSEKQAKEIIKGLPDASVSAVNTSDDCTISGKADSIAAALERAKQSNTPAVQLKVAAAYHSPMVDELHDPFIEAIAGMGIRWKHPKIPFYSTVTGGRHDGPFDEQYWWRNIRSCVQFANPFRSQPQDKEDITPSTASLVLEVSPHAVLSTYIKKLNTKTTVCPSMRRNMGLTSFLQCIGGLYVSGANIDWKVIYPNTKKSDLQIYLPKYPWEHQHYFKIRPVTSVHFEYAEKHGKGSKNASHSAPAKTSTPQVKVVEKIVETVKFVNNDEAFTAVPREIPLNRFPFIADHVIDGAVIFPASAYLSLSIDAAMKDGIHELRDASFNKMLVLNKATNSFHCQMAYDGAAWAFKNGSTIFSRGSCSAPSHDPTSTPYMHPSPIGSEAARSHCKRAPVSKTDFYDSLKGRRMNYLPAYQTVHSIWTGDDEALIEIEPRPECGLAAHPAVIEGCMQSLAACVEVGKEMFLPAKLGALWVKNKLPNADLVAHAYIENADESHVRGNVDVYTTMNEHVMSFRGLELHCVQTPYDSTVTQWLFNLELQRSVIPSDVAKKSLISSDNLTDSIVETLKNSFSAMNEAKQASRIVRILDIGGSAVDSLPQKLLENKEISAVEYICCDPSSPSVKSAFLSILAKKRSPREGPWFKLRTLPAADSHDPQDMLQLEVRPSSFDMVILSNQALTQHASHFVLPEGHLVCTGFAPQVEGRIISVTPSTPAGLLQVASVGDSADADYAYVILEDVPDSTPLVEALLKILPGSITANISNLSSVLSDTPMLKKEWAVIDPSGIYSPQRPLLLAHLKILESHRSHVCNAFLLTSGGAVDGSNMEAAAYTGFCRSVRNETIGRVHVTCLDVCFEKKEAINMAREISEIVTRPFGSEYDIALRNGKQQFLRVVPTHLPELSGDGFAMERRNDRIAQRLLDSKFMQDRLGDDEILIKVDEVCLQFKDAVAGLGLLPGLVSGIQIGQEVVGVVMSAGKNVSPKLSVGTKVLAAHPHGTLMATHITVPQICAVAAPKNLEATSPLGVCGHFQTAYWALYELARLQKGETVLIHSAAGGVGLAAIRLAKRIGAKIIATAGSDEKRSMLKTVYGIECVSNSRVPSVFAKDVMEYTQGKGVNVVFSSLTGEGLQTSLDILSANGRFVDISKLDAVSNTRIGLGKLLKNQAYFCLQTDMLFPHQAEKQHHILEEIVEMLEKKEIDPLPTTVHPISQLQNVLKTMAQGTTTGLTVIKINQEERPMPTSNPAIVIDPHKSYLVTGAFGGIGWWLSLWLTTLGAKHLILTGSKGPVSNRGKRLVETLTNNGVQVLACKMDAGNTEEVAKIFEQATPKIAGVFHLATVYEDALLRNLNPEKVERGMHAKAIGALNLHKASEKNPVDFMVYFTSIGAIPGNPGQAIYNAANIFCETLSQLRNKEGHPTLSLGIPAISGAGVLSWFDARDVLTQLNNRGLSMGMAPRQAIFRILEELLPRVMLKQTPPAVIVNNCPWEYTWCQNLSIFSHLYKSNDRDSAVVKSPAPTALAPKVAAPTKVAAPKAPEKTKAISSTKPAPKPAPKAAPKAAPKPVVKKPKAKKTKKVLVTKTRMVKKSIGGSGSFLAGDEAKEAFLGKLAELIGVDANTVNLDAPLTDFGVDSLAAVELATWLKTELGITTSQMEVLGGITSEQLLSRTPEAEGGRDAEEIEVEEEYEEEIEVTDSEAEAEEQEEEEPAPKPVAKKAAPKPAVKKPKTKKTKKVLVTKTRMVKKSIGGSGSFLAGDEAKEAFLSKLAELIGVDANTVNLDAPLTGGRRRRRGGGGRGRGRNCPKAIKNNSFCSTCFPTRFQKARRGFSCCLFKEWICIY
eukprot:TRINITY_DN139_c0_g2_i2.p1 TRINITY_DN139_c0_g2~~TRINITY_DN139_c0_g2_i2.p1  ORF type:complete len:2631 (+),score=774.09 TRINITY_DN139_c0_g2_i2:57-7949(+)